MGRGSGRRRADGRRAGRHLTRSGSGGHTELAGSWTTFKAATWYGPGFWGMPTACGTMLTKTTIGVAHKKLPCGTVVTFSYGGRSVTATVIDRGPFRKGYAWDLTKKTAKRVGFLAVGAGQIQATVTPPGA